MGASVQVPMHLGAHVRQVTEGPSVKKVSVGLLLYTLIFSKEELRPSNAKLSVDIQATLGS